MTIVFAPPAATMLELTVPADRRRTSAGPLPGRTPSGTFRARGCRRSSGAGTSGSTTARQQAQPSPCAPADVVAWEEPPSVASRARRRGAMALPVLHEDDDLLVIDKAAGHGHAPRARQRRGHARQRAAGPLPDALGHRRRTASGDRPPARQGHHRLPRGRQERLSPTVRSRPSSRRARRVKIYLALVRGVPKRRLPGRLTRPSDGIRSTARKWRWSPRRNGRSARTDYRVRRTFAADPAIGRGPVSLVECRLHTGRTHQIRVHMQAPRPSRSSGTCSTAARARPRAPMLHAWTLALRPPAHRIGSGVSRAAAARFSCLRP